MKIDIGNKTKNFNERIKNNLKKNKKNLSKVKENIENKLKNFFDWVKAQNWLNLRSVIQAMIL